METTLSSKDVQLSMRTWIEANYDKLMSSSKLTIYLINEGVENTAEDDFMATIDTGAYVQAKMSYLLTAYEGQDMRLKSNPKVRIVKVEAE